MVRSVRVMASDRLRTHEVTLRSGPVTLRPLTEGDWDLVVGWWNDAEIAYYADAEPIKYAVRAGAGDRPRYLQMRLLFRH